MYGRVLRGRCLAYQVFTCAASFVFSFYSQDARYVSIFRFNVAVVVGAAAGVNTREMEYGGVDEDEIIGIIMKRSKFLGIRLG